MYEFGASLAKIHILGSEKKYLTSIFFGFSKKKSHPPNDSTFFLSIGAPDGRENAPIPRSS